jgi:hypothetical protein
MNPDRIIGVIGEPHTVVSNPQSQLARLAFQFFNSASAAFCKTVNRAQNAESCRPVDSADISSRLL